MPQSGSANHAFTTDLTQFHGMFIQGNLQPIFDALYAVGAIDPVLKMDWQKVTADMAKHPDALMSAFQEINSCRGDFEKLKEKLYIMDQKSLTYIAMEVAREFAEFQDRKEIH